MKPLHRSRTDHALDWLQPALDELEQLELLRTLGQREGPQTAEVVVDGKQLINFGSNDYLGLANDPRVLQRAADAIADAGWGSGASPLVSGRSRWHVALEDALAEHEQTEAALLFPTGYAANVGTIVGLVQRGDAILSDAKNHASIIDGCRLSGADVHVYPHNDVDAASDILSRSETARRILIVTDGLFSMDGDYARLAELANLAELNGAMLMVDEAHATGVAGKYGRGVCELFDIESCPGLIRTGTLSKALGSIGGFVVGSAALVQWLANRSRSYVFSTAAPAAACAAAVEALQLVRQTPEVRDRLLDLARDVRDSLHLQGWNVGEGSSQIVPIVVGDPAQTMNLASTLRREGLFVPGIRPPSVPQGESLLRISLTAGHTDEMFARLLSALASASG